MHINTFGLPRKIFPDFFDQFFQKSIQSDIYSKKNMRKVKFTLSQLKKILESENPKFPIVFEVSNFTPKELKEFSQLFQSKKERS